jgi:hypothetical protein
VNRSSSFPFPGRRFSPWIGAEPASPADPDAPPRTTPAKVSVSIQRRAVRQQHERRAPVRLDDQVAVLEVDAERVAGEREKRGVDPGDRFPTGRQPGNAFPAERRVGGVPHAILAQRRLDAHAPGP